MEALPWGTGKTSIVRLLQELVEGDKTKLLTLVYLDVWKYSSDPLKRWILLETERQLEDQRIVTDYQYQNRTLASHLEYEEAWEERGQVQLRYDLLTKYLPLITSISAVLCLALIGFVDSGFPFLRALSYPITEPRNEICKQLIQHGEMLENPERNHISELLVNRYTAPNGENEVLGLLRFAAEDPGKRGWVKKDGWASLDRFSLWLAYPCNFIFF